MQRIGRHTRLSRKPLSAENSRMPGFSGSQVLAALGLTNLVLESPAAALSDGYKRRLALAVQLTRGPALLLLDEPLAGLDWASRADIAQLLGAFQAPLYVDTRLSSAHQCGSKALRRCFC